MLGTAVILAAAPAPAPVASAKASAEAKIYKGQEAIERLGERLPKAAAAHGVSAKQLRHELRTNSALALNENDRVFWLDAIASPDSAAFASPVEQAFQGEQDVDPAEPFPKLHSDPGQTNKIYLDFDGGTYRAGFDSAENNTSSIISGTRNISAYSGGAESIYRVWQRVAEDWAPFNVDVTTERPLQMTPGILVSVGGTPAQAGFSSEVGGVAPWGGGASIYFPAKIVFVFSAKFGNDEAEVADTISHEAGHIFGLDHDGLGASEYYGGHGSGATAWGPIMGLGSTGLSHWSKGEYPGATNTEDDVSRIAGILSSRADDNPAGQELMGAPDAVDQPGMIETTADVDDFTFATDGGAASFTIALGPQGPNLDAQLSLLDDSGNLIATANDPFGLGGMIVATLPPGRYHLTVDGVGDIDPLPGYSDYASLGQYRITGSYPDANGPPDCSAVAADVVTLWPPNHNLRSVTLAGATDPDGEPTVLTIGTVTQDEPLNGTGDGDTSPDAAAGATSDAVRLRAERSGGGDGRIYRIGYEVEDPHGASCEGSVEVAVPLTPNQPAVDSGQAVDSFEG
jgi:hypothetical protein